MLGTQGVAGGGILQADGGNDIAGVDLLNILSVVGVHLKDAAQTFLLALGAVEHRRSSLYRTGIDPEEGEAAHIGVGHDLEGQSGEGSLIVGRTFFFFLRLGVDAADGGDISRCGHIVHDGIQQLLHALVAIRRTADHGNHLVVDGAAADSGADLVGGDVLPFQHHHHDVIINVGNTVQQLFSVFLCHLQHIGRNFFHPHIFAHIIVIDVSVHLHQVDDASEGILGADGQLDGHSVGLQAVMNHVQHAEEICAHDVHLIDVDHTGNLVMVSLAPDGLRLGFHTALGAQDGHAAVQHTQGALHFHGKVHVARSVDNVNAVIPPETGGGSTGDGDASLLLLNHPVHGGSALMGLAKFVIYTGVVQDAFSRGSLTGIDMCHNTDVSRFLK